MTRTQKLNLFTWALNDPVDLDQINESAGRIISLKMASGIWNEE